MHFGAPFFETVKKLPVGADAYIGPVQNVSYSPKKEENELFYCRSDVGIAPYASERGLF